MALAARLPKLCTAASSPNADPRSSTGARAPRRRARPSPHSRWPPRRPRTRAPGPGRWWGRWRSRRRPARTGRHRGPGPGRRRGGRRAGRRGRWPGWRRGCRRRTGRGRAGWPGPARGRGEQLGGSQDEQRGGDVAELEGRHPDHEPAEPPGQHRPDAQPERLALALLGAGGVADGVDDGQGGQQAGDDRQGDGGADPDQADQGQGEQGADDGAEVVHGPLEPIGPPVDAGRDDVGQQGVAGRDPQAPGRPRRRRAASPTCQTAVAAPMRLERTAVAV